MKKSDLWKFSLLMWYDCFTTCACLKQRYRYEIREWSKKSVMPVLITDLSTTVELCNPTKISTVGALTKLAS
jgi:hypothetical protein